MWANEDMNLIIFTIATNVSISKCFVMLWIRILPQSHKIRLLASTLVQKSLHFAWHFMDFELMNALSILYSQFWMQLDINSPFFLYLSVINKHYCESYRAKPSLDHVVEPLNANLLDL
jgi:hypothetical protein